MDIAHLLVTLLRPVVWGLVAIMVVAFGKVFLKRLFNIIAIFLFLISLGGAYYVGHEMTRLLDPYSFATNDDWTLCIVGTVSVICFMLAAVGYMLFAQTIDAGDGKVSKHSDLLRKIVAWMVLLIFPFAIMGYSLPFFLLDSVAGFIVGVIAESIGVIIIIVITIVAIVWKKKPNSSKVNQSENNTNDNVNGR